MPWAFCLGLSLRFAGLFWFSRGPIPLQRASTEGLAGVVGACREHKPLEERLRQPCTLEQNLQWLGGFWAQCAGEFI